MADFEFSPTVERWGVFEAAVHGEEGADPFAPGLVEGVFRYEGKETGAVHVEGFYDGGGVWRVRFMPQFEGEYTFEITGPAAGRCQTGKFTASKPAAGNHGPLRVANTYHFAFEDGTPFVPVGTTCYVWEWQTKELQKQTLETLKSGPFNKMRYCVFPKHYVYNFRDPEMFPFEGKPCSTEGMTEENFMQWNKCDKGNDWNFDRLNPAYFRHVEESVLSLQKMGIEADLILLHPYDRWGFSMMDAKHDDRYLHYVVSRLAAFRNVWWAMANEWDLMPQKSVADWERMAEVVRSCDPYRHLQSIHNCRQFYDHNRPWVTHCSIQRQDLYKSAELTDEWRAKWQKPIVLDEIAYEGNIQYGWGNISGKELVRRFWEAACRGGYGGHGETFMPQSGGASGGILWWSHGGTLRGESAPRIAFLRKIMEDAPAAGLGPCLMNWDDTCGVSDDTMNAMLPVKDYYLFYYGFERPSFRDFYVDDTTRYQVDVIDTWGMTVKDCGVHSGHFRVELPGHEYMAVRLVRK